MRYWRLYMNIDHTYFLHGTYHVVNECEDGKTWREQKNEGEEPGGGR